MQAIKENIKDTKRLLNNNQKICFVAKANCYGLGAKKVCEYVNDDVDYFAVSCEEEFFQIQKIVKKPILILNPIYENITKIARANGEICVCNQESFEKVLSVAKQNNNVIYKIHIAVNTGMNRLGFSDEEDVLNVFKICEKVQNISILGVFSHYFNAKDDFCAKNQYKKFEDIKNEIEQCFDTSGVIFHLASSDAVVMKNGFDMVRVGMKMYEDILHETIKLTSKIIDFKFLKKGESAGYNGVFVASRNSVLAVVQIGYADVISRNIYKYGYVLINNSYAKIVAVCMDSIIVDVTDILCKIYDDVILIGKDKTNQIFICDVARWCDTIGYEIISKLSLRIKREYLRWNMQIITGKYRARKLIPVDAETTRPTLARVKESVFNLIQGEIAGAVVLDLFAGSGAFGAECISRGASKVVFIDKELKAIKTIKENTKNMNENFEIVHNDFVSALSQFETQNLKFDLVYLDPPFSSDFFDKALKLLHEKHLLSEDAVVVVEHDLQNDLQNAPECYIMKKSKKYGTIFIDILIYKG